MLSVLQLICLTGRFTHAFYLGPWEQMELSGFPIKMSEMNDCIDFLNREDFFFLTFTVKSEEQDCYFANIQKRSSTYGDDKALQILKTLLSILI